MTTSGIAQTYARVLFDLASAAESVDASGESLRAAVNALRGSIDLRTALSDTTIPVEKKRDVVREVFGTSVTPETLSIVTMAVDRGQADELGAVADAFDEIAEAERNIVFVEVTTAIELDEATRGLVSQKLSESLGRPVTLREHVDASLIGGIRIKVAGKVLDGSISSQLDAMRTALTSSSAGGEG